MLLSLARSTTGHGTPAFSQSSPKQPSWLPGVASSMARGSPDGLDSRDARLAKYASLARWDSIGKARNIRAFGEYGASSTSFYTDVEKQDSYDDLDKVLDAKMANPQVKAVIKEMLGAIADITE